MSSQATVPNIVSHDDWLSARTELLAKEKAALQTLDQVSEMRRQLPWVAVEKSYQFETDDGRQPLSQLFGDCRQLIIYHFMFGPGWEEGCVGCSFVSDHFDGANKHLANHDVSLVVCSRAPRDEFQPFRKRMGWKFPWVSSAGSDFSFDFGAAFTPDEIEAETAFYNYRTTGKVIEDMQGLSVFFKEDDGSIFHTYSTYARGLDLLLGAHNLLDLTPKGRNEKSVMDWVRHHDRYADADATRIQHDRTES